MCPETTAETAAFRLRWRMGCDFCELGAVNRGNKSILSDESCNANRDRQLAGLPVENFVVDIERILR